MSTLLRRNKLPSGLCLCVLAFVTAVSFLSCNDVSVGSGECPGVNEFLDRISGNDKKPDTTKPVIVDAAVPSITEHPLNGAADVGTPHRIFVNANVEDGGTLQYQWYSNNYMSNVGGWLINGAIDSVYTVPTFGEGTFYYYVMVTNVNSKVNGNITATARSGVAMITVGSVTNASAPNITADPATQNVFAEEGGSVQLSVAASSPDGGTLSYQWYLSINGSNFDGIMIPDAVEPSYTVSTSAAGISHYYVVVTNTNTEVNGLHTAVSISRTAAVMVTVEGVENAAVPTINLIDDVNVKTSENVVLNVTASVSDGGTLSYQWYHQIFENDWVWLPIEGETGISYSVPTSAAGGSHYYVVVTNTNSEVNGEQIMPAVSNLVTVVVNAIVDAQEPVILSQPVSTRTITKDTEESISVVASGVSDGGILSYQWYHQINQEWQPIEDAVYSSYIVPTSTVGKFNYFVIVTNTNIHVNGKTTVSVTSQTSIVTIAELNINDAQVPRITEQPSGGSVGINGTYTLSVTASVTDSGELSYQWFSTSNTGDRRIQDATDRFYTVSAATLGLGSYSYYVVVTNTNNSVNGNTTATEKSNTVTITVTPPTFQLHINTTVGGNVSPAGLQNVTSGVALPITAAAQPGYRFVNWTVYTDSSIVRIENQNNPTNATVTVTGNGGEIRANFERIYTLNINRSPTDGGTITPSGTHTVVAERPFTISAEPATGYRFVKWTGTNDATFGSENSANTTVTLRGNANIQANFAQLFTLTLARNIAAGGSVHRNDLSEILFQIRAIPENGYAFVNWIVNGEVTFTTGTVTSSGAEVLLSSNATLTANFRQTSVHNAGLLTTGDNKSYPTVEIGGKIWMAKNLNNSDPENSLCYENLNSNCDTYGRLYDWNAAMNACPVGWHLPTGQEWNNLFLEAGGINSAATALRSVTGWTYNPTSTNSSGFKAMPGGHGSQSGQMNIGSFGFWWSAEESTTNAGQAYHIQISNSETIVRYNASSKSNVHSVRCVRD